MKYSFLFLSGTIFAAIGLMATAANAALITFEGVDAGANSTDPRPNSNAAAASFDAAASALGTANLINFESAPVGTYTNLTIAPGVSLSGTDFTGNSSGQSIRSSPFDTPDSLFGYNTTAGGSNFAFINGGFITFAFATPVDAFGAYISGVQFVGETLTFNDGSSQFVLIFDPGPSGGVEFVGLIDAGKLISSISLDTENPSNTLGDFVGVDDVRYVNAQAVPAPVVGRGAPVLLALVAVLLGARLVQRRDRRPPQRRVTS